MPRETIQVEPLDEEVDHVRGPAAGRLILMYGDYECPYTRQAFREIERVEQELAGPIRFAYRHFPLVEIHPHAFAAAAAAEAAAHEDRFWERRDVESGVSSGEVRGTPTLFIDGVLHLGGYNAVTLMEALAN